MRPYGWWAGNSSLLITRIWSFDHMISLQGSHFAVRQLSPSLPTHPGYILWGYCFSVVAQFSSLMEPMHFSSLQHLHLTSSIKISDIGKCTWSVNTQLTLFPNTSKFLHSGNVLTLFPFYCLAIHLIEYWLQCIQNIFYTNLKKIFFFKIASPFEILKWNSQFPDQTTFDILVIKCIEPFLCCMLTLHFLFPIWFSALEIFFLEASNNSF